MRTGELALGLEGPYEEKGAGPGGKNLTCSGKKFRLFPSSFY